MSLLPKSVLLLLIFLMLLKGQGRCSRVFPIPMKDGDVVSFKNQHFLRNLLYRKEIQPGYALKLSFRDINLGSSQLQVFSRTGKNSTIEMLISGKAMGTVNHVLRLVDYGGVFVPRETGTFTFSYTYVKTCDHFCAVDQNTLQSVRCGLLPEKHRNPCVACKANGCIAQMSFGVELMPPLMFGVVYCPMSGPSVDADCTRWNEENSTCTFACKEGYFPGVIGRIQINATCRHTTGFHGEWEGYPDDFCLSQETILQSCLTDNATSGKSCTFNIEEVTETFDETSTTTIEQSISKNNQQSVSDCEKKKQERKNKRVKRRCEKFCVNRGNDNLPTCDAYKKKAKKKCLKCRDAGHRCNIKLV